MRLAVSMIVAAVVVAQPAAAQTAADGAKLFAARCGVCHYAPDKMPQQARMGPSLRGIVGRKAGTLPSFPRYSKAMKSFGKPWTTPLLDTYLNSPQKVVPGTIMAFAGLKQPAERAAVVAYLKANSGH